MKYQLLLMTNVHFCQSFKFSLQVMIIYLCQTSTDQHTDLVTMNQLATLCTPNVHTLVKASTCKKLPVWGECHTVHRLLVPDEYVGDEHALHDVVYNTW